MALSLRPSLIDDLFYDPFPFRTLVTRTPDMLAQLSQFTEGSARCNLVEVRDPVCVRVCE